MFLLLLIVLTTAVLIFFKINNEYWKKRGVPGPSPWYLVGNMGPVFTLKKSMFDIFNEMYNKYQHPIVGLYRANTPVLLVRDPEVIKDMMVKSFSHFADNDLDVDKGKDPIFGRNPFVLKGEEWKTVRQQLTPAFTSGKMKWIYPHLEQISQGLVDFIERQQKTADGLNAKNVCARFTLNNVASCAFGLDGKCFEEDNNEFTQIAKDFLSPGGQETIVFFLTALFPTINKIFKPKLVPASVEEKLSSIVTETIKYREKNNIVRNDILHILQELKKTCTAYKFTDVDVTAHASTFFADGYETSATVMSFFLYDLANNPEAQSKLREELNQHFEENDGKMPYEVLHSLQYLDAAFNESMRLHPPLGALSKRCTKPYTYVPKDSVGKPMVVEKGTPIIISLWGLFNDTKYFDNPEEYNPERFLGGNKEKLVKGTFMPFGDGPRACLGQRFGSLQVKIGVAYLIKNFELCVNKKTQQPLKMDPLSFITAPIGGLWLDFKKI